MDAEKGYVYSRVTSFTVEATNVPAPLSFYCS
jgi:hypothetical protein